MIFTGLRFAGETTLLFLLSLNWQVRLHIFLLDLKCQATIHVFASRSKQAGETTYFLLGLKCWRDYNF